VITGDHSAHTHTHTTHNKYMLSSDYDDSFNSIMQNYIFILRTQPKFLNTDTYHVLSNKKKFLINCSSEFLRSSILWQWTFIDCQTILQLACKYAAKRLCQSRIQTCIRYLGYAWN